MSQLKTWRTCRHFSDAANCVDAGWRDLGKTPIWEHQGSEEWRSHNRARPDEWPQDPLITQLWALLKANHWFYNQCHIGFIYLFTVLDKTNDFSYCWRFRQKYQLKNYFKKSCFLSPRFCNSHSCAWTKKMIKSHGKSLNVAKTFCYFASLVLATSPLMRHVYLRTSATRGRCVHDVPHPPATRQSLIQTLNEHNVCFWAEEEIRHEEKMQRPQTQNLTVWRLVTTAPYEGHRVI